MKEYILGIVEYFEGLGPFGLGLMAFLESSFFPIPPDLLLIAMSLTTPQKALLFALICTIFSALGGGFGYLLGKFGGRPIFNKIFKNKEHYLEKVEGMYKKYGVWAVLGAAFTPIPYKVFTIASGIFSMNFPGFMIASVIGRGARFFIVSSALMIFGQTIKSYLEFIIIAITVLLGGFYWLVYKKRHKLYQS